MSDLLFVDIWVVIAETSEEESSNLDTVVTFKKPIQTT